MSTSDADATQKVSLNPIDHLKAGANPFIKTNLGAAVVAVIASSVASTALAAVFVAGGIGLFMGTGTAQGFLFLILTVLLAAVVVGFFSSVVNRLVVTGARSHKEDFVASLKFVYNRLPKIVLTYLLVVAVFILGLLVIGILGQVSAVLGALLSFAGAIAAIVLALHIAYLPLILVDNREPGKPMDVIRRSAALWNRSQGALILYILAWVAVYVVISLFSKNTDKYALGTGSMFTLAYPAVEFVFVSALISSLISNIFGTLVYAGQASIYNDAAKLVGGKSSSAPKPPK